MIFDIRKPGVAKFEFVGTNKSGNLTTYHIESGKDFWKLVNDSAFNRNITPFDYITPQEEFTHSFRPGG